MPELAEIKLMSDFINESHNFVANYETVAINPSTKVKTELSCLTDKKFRVRSESRGKELRVSFFDLDGKTISPNGNESLYFAMGMSGNWLLMRNDKQTLEKIKTSSSIKHIKISFIGREVILVMHDMRNFAKWRWETNWKDSRGPCPLHEFEEFKSHIYKMLDHPRKKKLRIKPLNEILMDQEYFNGIGNYLRSTILNRFGENPFKTFSEISEEHKEKLLQLCHEIPEFAYKAGGGQSYIFKNPAAAQIKKEYKMIDILDCYGRKDLDNVTFIDDKSRRRFWFDKKWVDSEITQKYLESLD